MTEAEVDHWIAASLLRLPVDRMEVRMVNDVGPLNIGQIAEYVNLTQAHHSASIWNRGDVDAAAARCSAAYHVLALAPHVSKWMRSQPLLAYQRDDGQHVLLDGLQRAYKAFDGGATTVVVLVVSESLALLLGGDGSTECDHPLLTHTKNYAMNAENISQYITNIVGISVPLDLKREGQKMSDTSSILLLYLDYYTILSVERELFVRKHFPRDASIIIDKKDSPDIEIEQQLIDGWYRQGALPVARPWKNVANHAQQAIRYVTELQNKSELKRFIKTEMEIQSREGSVQLRDDALRARSVLLKAFYQSKSHRSKSIKVGHLADSAKLVRRRVADVWIRESERGNTTLGLQDQIDLCRLTGINPIEFDTQFTRYDNLFSAYCFIESHAKNRLSNGSLWFVISYLQRRMIAIANELHNENKNEVDLFWDDVFELYRERGFTDKLMCLLLSSIGYNRGQIYKVRSSH